MGRASLPANGYHPRERIDLQNACVYFISENGEDAYRFRFDRLPGSPEIQRFLMRSFARATGPMGTRRTLASAESSFAGLRRFAILLAKTEYVDHPRELRKRHILMLGPPGDVTTYTLISTLRSAFRGDPDLHPSFLTALFRPIRRKPPTPTQAYSRSEYRQIMRQARARVQEALEHVRCSRRDCDEETESSDRVVRLRWLRRHGNLAGYFEANDVPLEHRAHLNALTFEELFPTRAEVAALLVLIVGSTGLNPSTANAMSVEHVKSSASEDPTGDVLFTRVSKPRRGPHRSEMTVAMQREVEDDARRTTASNRDDLRTPLGIYEAALELGADIRRLMQSKRLLVTTRGRGAHREYSYIDISSSSTHLDYIVDGATTTVRLSGLRKSYLERTQRPVAHTDETLASTYLSKNPVNLADYQRVVHHALDEVMAEAIAASKVRSLSRIDLLDARERPEDLGKKLGLSPTKVIQLVEGQLDTVASACASPEESPFGTDLVGRCTASFLLCLGCPCAISEPRHHPIQAFLWETLRELEKATPRDEWVATFAIPFAQLTDLLASQRVDTAHAAGQVSATDKQLVYALVEGRLELR